MICCYILLVELGWSPRSRRGTVLIELIERGASQAVVKFELSQPDCESVFCTRPVVALAESQKRTVFWGSSKRLPTFQPNT